MINSTKKDSVAAKILLKDQIINPEKIRKIADEIYQVYPTFAAEKFSKLSLSQLGNLELKARIAWVAKCLTQFLPADYKKAIAIILKSLPPPCDPSKSDNDFGDFIYCVYNDFVAQNGCEKKHLQTSFKALKELTTRFSVEYAIRSFINKFPEETFNEINSWQIDKHYHLRRLCSEGTRPKLPWGEKINVDYTKTLPIIENLYADPTRFVTRSVANHLNDISKINPQVVVETLIRWQNSKKQNPAEMNYIINHSLRTLIKKGDSAALKILGFSKNNNLIINNFTHQKLVKLNSDLTFSFSLFNNSENEYPILIDYIVYFQNKLGKINNCKIFKLGKYNLAARKSKTITKTHPFRLMTTRKLYQGKHKIAIQVNGEVIIEKDFLLVFPQ